jgi:hypothetical protein
MTYTVKRVINGKEKQIELTDAEIRSIYKAVDNEYLAEDCRIQMGKLILCDEWPGEDYDSLSDDEKKEIQRKISMFLDDIGAGRLDVSIKEIEDTIPEIVEEFGYEHDMDFSDDIIWEGAIESVLQRKF